MFMLDSKLGYFRSAGVDVMAFDDIYPEGHQSGVSIIMHGNRVATNGDIRFEPTPGQWQPVPKQGERTLGENEITTALAFPDEARHLKGFNPMIYPNVQFGYKVKVRGEGKKVIVTVEFETPAPGGLWFNLELFPGALFGKPWIMDGKQGIFPEQPNGPVLQKNGEKKGYDPIVANDLLSEPYATGKRFTLRPDDPLNRLTIESKGSKLQLFDGRMNHNNGWFVISSEVPQGGGIEWVITPNVVEDWIYEPVVQVSQVGYHPAQPKAAVIELDNRTSKREKPALIKITETGEETAVSAAGEEWGQFLRYNYLKFDFSGVRDEGLYKVRYGSAESDIFRIAADVYDRGVWQPVLEYFLPVQMCHMRVSEKYRVWHGLCHDSDAVMAPVNLNHFDGYIQGASTLTKYQPGDKVPGLNVGGWHDAGDYDLRVESQAGEFYVLAMAYEAFGVYYDATSIDQRTRVTEIHQPDGKNDILQQVEHGVLSVVGAYRALGRLYRGIIETNLREYVHLGDSASILGERWVFTEENPTRELTTAAQLAAASRVLRGFNDELSGQALEAAQEIYKVTDASEAKAAKVHAAVELFLTTEGGEYKDFLLAEASFIAGEIDKLGWFTARAVKAIGDADFTREFEAALPALKESLAEQSAETPYGIPYRPHIWGAGWGIQRLGYQYYFLHREYPGIFGAELIFDALNFILGCHPGSNRSSFASGVGARSATVGYGLNRADWSYIPGGVVSGTALIRPDFPELLVFPYLWQQVEYVMGGGSSHYMFLVLAVVEILG